MKGTEGKTPRRRGEWVAINDAGSSDLALTDQSDIHALLLPFSSSRLDNQSPKGTHQVTDRGGPYK